MRYFVTYQITGGPFQESQGRWEIETDERIVELSDILRIEDRLSIDFKLDSRQNLKVIDWKRFERNYDSEQVTALLFVFVVVVAIILWSCFR